MRSSRLHRLLPGSERIATFFLEPLRDQKPRRALPRKLSWLSKAAPGVQAPCAVDALGALRASPSVQLCSGRFLRSQLELAVSFGEKCMKWEVGYLWSSRRFSLLLLKS
eukprot:6188571-Pleurochrysis_carterae.AAC.3